MADYYWTFQALRGCERAFQPAPEDLSTISVAEQFPPLSNHIVVVYIPSSRTFSKRRGVGKGFAQLDTHNPSTHSVLSLPTSKK